MPRITAPFMRNVWCAVLFAYSANAQAPEPGPTPEPRTWTFSQDGRIETQAGVWSFKKGGRIDAKFVRLIGTNAVLVKLAVNGNDGRLTITSLSDDDCLYLANISGQPMPTRPKPVPPQLEKPAPDGLVETRVDAATGQTTYLQKQPTNLGPPGDPRSLNLQAYVLEQVPDFVAIHFTSRCPADLGWQYATDRRITFIFDDQKMELGDPKRLGTTGDGYLLEQFTPRCKLTEFKELACARNLEVRLGRQVFKLSYESRSAWRSLVTFVETQHAEVDQ
jgi:hypothetical protein